LLQHSTLPPEEVDRLITAYELNAVEISKLAIKELIG